MVFPFFAAFLLAYIVDPIVGKLEKKFKHRIIAVVTVLLAAALIIAGFCKFFIPLVVREVQSLGSMISKMFTDSDWSARLSNLLPDNVVTTIRTPSSTCDLVLLTNGRRSKVPLTESVTSFGTESSETSPPNVGLKGIDKEIFPLLLTDTAMLLTALW